MSELNRIMRISRVIPVVTIPDNTDVTALGEALLAGGVSIIEITLRTPAAMDAVAAMTRQFPQMCVGAGTVWQADQARAVIDAGVEFLVSPGISMSVHEVCTSAGVPLLPGAQTVSEVAHWRDAGQTAVKFFPASVAGGVSALKAFSAVFQGLEFCPTGGINERNVEEYLALDSVPCVGGSWVVPENALVAADWPAITEAARKVSQL